jgi:ketosteroid isomerase-like protein
VTDSANVELVRSIYAAREGGDYSSAEWAHPDIEFVIVGGPTPGSWTGVGAMVNAWRDFLSAWHDVRPDVEEYRELDDERVIVLGRMRGRGKASGLELEQMQARTAALYHVRDGKVTRLVAFLDPERALAELDLAPEGGVEHS